MNQGAYNQALATNVAAFNAALVKYVVAFRVGRRTAIRFAAGKMVDRLFRFTPPGRLSKGEKNVRRDIRLAVAPLNPSAFRNRRIKEAIRERDYRALRAIFQNFKGGWAGVVVTPFDPSLHRQAQDYRGRVRNWSRRVTPDVDALRAYIAKIKGHVGWAKGSWVAAARALGRDILPWVARHPEAGAYEDTLDERGDSNPAIRITSRTDWAIRNEARIKSNALKEVNKDLLKAVAEQEQRAQREASAISRSAGASFARLATAPLRLTS